MCSVYWGDRPPLRRRGMAKRRGAPRGNQNAYKHGFYSAAFRQAEQDRLGESAPGDLVDEISLIRVSIARCLAALESKDQERDIDTELAILRTINLGALSINSLVRTRLMLARGLGSLPAGIWPSEIQEESGPPENSDAPQGTG